jgi:hypothetical protein
LLKELVVCTKFTILILVAIALLVADHRVSTPTIVEPSITGLAVSLIDEPSVDAIRQRRLLAAFQAQPLGHVGITRMAESTGLDRKTIPKGCRN